MKIEILTKERILEMWDDFNESEKMVASMQFSRLHEGQRRYGKWKPGDGRDKLIEAMEECADLPNYIFMKLVEILLHWRDEQ